MGEAAEGTSAASPEAVEPDVVRESEHHPTASVAAVGGASSTSSIPSLSVPSVGAADRGKAPMDPADEKRSGSRSVPPSAQYPEGASALADHNLARRLCQGILLPTDVESLRSRQVTEMLSRFYPTMVELIYTMSELEAGYQRFGNVRAAYKERSAAAEAERAMLGDHLQQSADREANIVPSGAEEEAIEEMADQPSGGVVAAEEVIPEEAAPTASPPPTEGPASAVDPAPLVADTPVIPDLPSVEEIDSDG
uniref:Uncharacterized protein LOC114913361 n=1 Tax=Elaeis guineensis var. tenera TaxID=51953 RepID=A0A8N4IDN3_ELAGV|nr:uncharacterized protein LOC114913361 [Elaeis guineensis]